jgi:hypothetical protein
MGANRSSVGSAQFGLSIAGSAVSLTPPDLATGAKVAEITVHTYAVSFTRDGTTPTATLGFVAYPDDIIKLNSRHEVDNFQAIRVTTTATLDVEYFNDLSG